MNKNNGLLLKNFNLDCSERRNDLLDDTGHWYDHDKCFISNTFITFKVLLQPKINSTFSLYFKTM